MLIFADYLDKLSSVSAVAPFVHNGCATASNKVTFHFSTEICCNIVTHDV